MQNLTKHRYVLLIVLTVCCDWLMVGLEGSEDEVYLGHGNWGSVTPAAKVCRGRSPCRGASQQHVWTKLI